jgi:hypothetical protein
MAWVPPTPRCGKPVEFRNVNAPRADLAPVCWRRRGHEGATPNSLRHLSYYAYMNELARKPRRRQAGYRRAA